MIREAVTPALDFVLIQRFDQIIDYVPDTAMQEKVDPVYETYPGWMSSTSDCRTWKDLPTNAQHYLKRIEELAGAPIWYVSVGPEREQMVVVREA